MKKVLVVDDEPDYRLVLRSVLSTQNFEVLMASNGEEALQKIEATPVDLIISDIYMPVMDGIKLHRTLRAMARYQTIPFLFVSAFDDQLTLEAVKDPRFDGFVRKARPVQELVEWVQYLMMPEEKRPKLPPGGARSRLTGQLNNNVSSTSSRGGSRTPIL